MTIQINYKNASIKKNALNLVFFIDENLDISSLKKHLLTKEYLFISDLIKSKDKKSKILNFDISSRKKIILVSFSNKIKNYEIENLGAKFFDLFKDNKINDYFINSDSVSGKLKNFIGHFLHGLKLKSYKFEKYKSKITKQNISFTIVGKNKTSLQDQLKFKSVEENRVKIKYNYR